MSTATARVERTRTVPAPRLVVLEGNTIAYDAMLREDLRALREAYDRKLAELRELRANVAGTDPEARYTFGGPARFGTARVEGGVAR